jgi:hypothetical protein
MYLPPLRTGDLDFGLGEGDLERRVGATLHTILLPSNCAYHV